MVQAAELRIGNMVRHLPVWSYRNKESVEFDFRWEERDWYQIGECLLDLDDIDPIPLTPEALLSAGFIKKIYSKHKDNKHLPDNIKSKEFCDFRLDGILIEFNEGGKVSVYLDDGAVLTVIHNVPQYLHQLQNLYFSLIGKELEVK